jgi:hypothetical protein
MAAAARAAATIRDLMAPRTRSGFRIDLAGVVIPARDGEVNHYEHVEARSQRRRWDAGRRVVFINGMDNQGAEHAESALALSLVQMCRVVGVYNKTAGWAADLVQCVFDKNQFQGASFTAMNAVAVRKLLFGQTPVEAARDALSRNPAAVAMFDLLRDPRMRGAAVFAHSQGNLILSNTLQALVAAGGPEALQGMVVHTFGSPAAHWPPGLTKVEHGFTWDPVTWLAGFDRSLSIAKVGMPSGTRNPVAHSFLEYLRMDPEFVVNRFRIGGLGVTFALDAEGLADCLLAMGRNLARVRAVFEHLDEDRNSHVDDVAKRYVTGLARAPAGETVAALRAERDLVQLLIRVMDEGWTTDEEARSIAFLRGLLA